jgi:hypothetical protein
MMLPRTLVLLGCLMVSLSCGSGHEAQKDVEPAHRIVEGSSTAYTFPPLLIDWRGHAAEWTVVVNRPPLIPHCDVRDHAGSTPEQLAVSSFPQVGILLPPDFDITHDGRVRLRRIPSISVEDAARLGLPPGGKAGECLRSDAEGEKYWGPCP